jgi:hypothetical protein
VKWSSEHTLRLIGGLALAGVIAWLVVNTEWVDIERPRPLPEELREDGSLLAREYLQALGLKPQRVDDLIALPPPGATLLLTAGYWDLIEGSSERLQRWVRDGGHLVIDAQALRTADGHDHWLPLNRTEPAAEKRPRSQGGCRVLRPREGLAPVAPEGYVACLRGRSRLLAVGALPTWALDSVEHGAEVLRVPLGRGRVTAFAEELEFDDQSAPVNSVTSPELNRQVRSFANRGIVGGDNAALLAALVDAKPGDEVWFVTRIERPALPLWLWQKAWPALLLAAVALGLALWRSGSRFGPLQHEPPPARRSLAAQIRGSADFLFRHQPGALQAMARRALDEAAARHIGGWRQLKRSQRPAALARATGLPEMRLAEALSDSATRAEVADALALLESARRALLLSAHPDPAVESKTR